MTGALQLPGLMVLLINLPPASVTKLLLQTCARGLEMS